MSNLFTVSVNFGDALAMLKRVSSGAVKRMMTLVVGEATRLVRRNFMKLNSIRSSRSNFYRQEGDAKTTSEVEADGLSGRIVVASYKMAHKLTGGTVRPVNARSIAIPLSDWARDVSRRQESRLGQRDDLRFHLSRNKKPILWQVLKGTDEEVPAFLLMKSVTHKPHPEVLPADADFTATVGRALEEGAKRL